MLFFFYLGKRELGPLYTIVRFMILLVKKVDCFLFVSILEFGALTPYILAVNES